MKTRFTAADCRAMVRDLRATVLGLRVVNVYDLDAKTYLIKLANPGDNKAMLLLESGVRFHSTKFSREKNDMPSGFSMKLRKHIRAKRLEDIRQIGTDRVVDFKFGSGDTCHHLLLELYAAGNIILTDSKYEILNLLRVHTYDGDVSVAVRQVYPVAMATTLEADPSQGGVDIFATNAAERMAAWLEAEATVVQREAEGLPPAGAPSDAADAAGATGGNGDGAAEGAAASGAVAGRAGAGSATAAPMFAGKAGPAKGKAAAQAAKRAKKMTLRQLLLRKGSGVGQHGPSIIDHCVLAACLDPVSKGTPTAEQVQALVAALREAPALVDALDRPGQAGYILYHKVVKRSGAGGAAGGAAAAIASAAAGVRAAKEAGKKDGTLAAAGGAKDNAAALRDGSDKKAAGGGAGTYGAAAAAAAADGAGGDGGTPEGEAKGEAETDENNVMYDEFLPHMLRQHASSDVHVRTFRSFDEAVDDFFGKSEEQKLVRQATAAEMVANKKLEHIRLDQQARRKALAAKQETMLASARALEDCAADVEKALAVVRSAVANGIGWAELDALVAAEAAAGNPIAALIQSLDLDNGRVVLRLPAGGGSSGKSRRTGNGGGGDDDSGSENEEKSGEEEKGGGGGGSSFVLVDVDYALSAHANARGMYDSKKRARDKELKTLEASERSLRIAEKTAAKDSRKQQARRTLAVARKVLWFEKFNWFITSDNYLVLSGKDAQQNEVIVKRYLRPCDIYVHADLHGASSCVIRSKDPTGTRPVSETALLEAGCMTVCRSAAWAAKMVTSAWWVYADQVSKTAPTGEYLVAGSFMIRGKKNFLPPRSLEMGFAVLFRVDESSLANHIGERREHGVEDDDDGGGTAGAGAAGAVAAAAGASGRGGEGRRVVPGLEQLRPQARPARQRLSLPPRQLLQEQSKQQPAGRREEVEEAGSADPANGSREGNGAEDRGEEAGDGQATANGDSGYGGGGGGDGGGGCGVGIGRRLSAKERRMIKKGKEGGQPGVPAAGSKPATAAAQEKGGDSGESGARDWGRDRGGGGNSANDGAAGEPPPPAPPAPTAGFGRRGKQGKIKRLKKYAEQDEEDRILALEALGHIKRPPSQPLPEEAGAGGGDGEEAAAAAASASSAKALAALRGDIGAAVAELPAAVAERLAALEEHRVMRLSEMDAFELQALGTFSEPAALEILDLFSAADLKKVRNKSGFLAGVMRGYGERVARRAQAEAEATERKATAAAAAGGSSSGSPAAEQGGAAANGDGAANGGGAEGGDSHAVSGGGGEGTVVADADTDAETGADGADGGEQKGGLSKRAQKRKEEEEMRRLLEEEGNDVGDGGGDGGEAEELDRLTGQPLPDDILLHALPVCAPYQSLTRYKHKVKLTPGSQKRGKVARQAVEVFTRAKDCPQRERDLILAMTDPEMVAVILGDVKMSMPGLLAVAQAKRRVQKQRGKGKEMEGREK